MSQDASGPGATMMLRLDRDVPPDVRERIRAAVDAGTLDVVDLS
jgi:D-3-phosphoglycerate dehydrogenase